MRSLWKFLLDHWPLSAACASAAMLAGAPDKPLLFAVADAIDEAARKIERL